MWKNKWWYKKKWEHFFYGDLKKVDFLCKVTKYLKWTWCEKSLITENQGENGSINILLVKDQRKGKMFIFRYMFVVCGTKHRGEYI